MTEFQLASYAVNEDKSRGRLYVEVFDDLKYRSTFGHDKARIVNSSAFRRLQYKTQVFVNHSGDHYRTRLTHSLEVAQIARWIAGALHVNKDLAEIVSLAHDLGHPPFGHAGEDALHEKMKDFGGFFHNSHTLKIITKIENRFLEFEGLNLSWEVLEGVIKHNGPVLQPCAYIKNYNEKFNLDLTKFSSIEAQIAAISDDIAYNNHDIEDGLRAGILSFDDLKEVPVVGEIYLEIQKKYPNLKHEILVGEAKKLITLKMVINVIESSKKAILENKINSEFDVRNCAQTLIKFSDEMQKAHLEIKKFLMKKMYRHEMVNKMTDNAKEIIAALFDFYFHDIKNLPKAQLEIAQNISSKGELATLVCDYIAGMTDRFASKEFEKIK